jgi:peroxiredoxin
LVVKKRILFILLIMVGGNAFLIPPLQGETSASSVQPDCPSCLSFGIQRFQEKKEAPHFSLKCLDGNTITLKDFKGKPVLLKFWATWCPTCKEELPVLEKFSTGKRDQLTIFLLAIDGEKEKRVQRFIKESKITLPVLLDPKEKIARTYGVKFIPAAFLVDREGMIIGAIVGERDWSSPAAWSAIKELLCLR